MSDRGSEERTEEASPNKLKKARDSGDVATSQAFVSACSAIGGVGAAWIFYDEAGARLETLFRVLLDLDIADPRLWLRLVRDTLLDLALPVLIGSAALSVLASLIVNRGLVLSFEKIKPNLSHLGLSSYASRTFSKTGFAILAEMILTTTLTFGALYLLHRYFVRDYFEMFACGVACGIDFLIVVIGFAIMIGLTIAFAIGLLDIRIQAALYRQNQRSTKTEAKRELKEELGEPHIRQARKGEHQRVLTAATLEEAVSSSTLLLHYGDDTAIAVRYVKLNGQDRFFVVEGAIAGGAARLIEAARRDDLPMARGRRDMATTLARYDNEREIHDIALIAELRRLIAHVSKTA